MSDGDRFRPIVSVVIPVYNESQRIVATLDTIRDYLERTYTTWEIIVVSDGCTDGVASTLDAVLAEEPRYRLLRYETNRGKGAAVREGVLVARGRRILFTDVDLSTPIECLAQLNESLDDGAAIAIASRHMPQSKSGDRQGRCRRLMSSGFRRTVRLLTGLRFTDTQCGFKLFSSAAAREIFPIFRKHDLDSTLRFSVAHGKLG